MLLAPPPVAKLTGFAEMSEGAEAKSRRFVEHYARVAQDRGCAFLDTGRVIVSSDLDGIHLEAGEQAKLGVAVAARVRVLLAWMLSPIHEGFQGDQKLSLEVNYGLWYHGNVI